VEVTWYCRQLRDPRKDWYFNCTCLRCHRCNTLSRRSPAAITGFLASILIDSSGTYLQLTSPGKGLWTGPPPTPSELTIAARDMETAYTDAGRPNTVLATSILRRCYRWFDFDARGAAPLCRYHSSAPHAADLSGPPLTSSSFGQRGVLCRPRTRRR
jgi:hypothetical protein